MDSKTFTSTSEYMNNGQASYEQLKQIQMQNVLNKIELSIHENMNKTIKQSLNDIDLLMQNPILKINSLPIKQPSSNSFLTPFFDDNTMDEIKDMTEHDRKQHIVGQKSKTSPPFFKDNMRISNYKGFNKFLPMNSLPFQMNNMKLEASAKCNGIFMEDQAENSHNFDPASYVNPQFIKGFH